jgi:pectate lyase
MCRERVKNARRQPCPLFLRQPHLRQPQGVPLNFKHHVHARDFHPSTCKTQTIKPTLFFTMKSKLRTSTTALALAPALAITAALTAATLAAALTATLALAADDVTVPVPSIQWNPIESGSTIPNTGNKAGFDLLTNDTLLLKKATAPNSFDNSAPADLITADGAGPFGNGRAIDFTSNLAMSGSIAIDPNPDLAGPVAGFTSGFDLGGAPGFTFTLWYKLGATFPDAGNYTTIFRNMAADNEPNKGAMDLVFLSNGSLRFYAIGDTANAAGSSNNIGAGVVTTLNQPGSWKFLAGTWDGANGYTALYYGTEELAVSRFKDGTLNTKGLLHTSKALNIGYQNLAPGSANHRTFKGQFADIRFYSTALTLDQLEKIRARSGTSTITSYLPTVRSWIETSLAGDYTDAKVDAATAAAAPAGVSNDRLFHAAATAARLWLLGGKTTQSHADRAFYILNALRAQRALTGSGFRIGFQAKFSLAETCGILIENNYAALNPAFDAAFLAAIKDMVRDSFGPAQLNDDNQGAFSAAGTTRALTLWPDLDTDTGGAWTNYIKTYWANWAARHDTQENSLNYNNAFLAYNILAAQHASAVPGLAAAAMRADLAHPATRAMLTRWRDQVSPGGSLPFYGDDGTGTPFRNLSNWPANFEWAAKTYADPTFRWAAGTHWRLNRNSATREPLHLFLMTYADEWADLSMDPVQPTPAPALHQTRPTITDPAEPDKIILAPSRDNGAPFVLAEAYSHGWHSHMEQAGAIYSFEHNNTIFLYGLGYNNRASDNASMVLINPASLPFPWRGYPQNNIWYEAAIPTNRLSEITNPASPLYGAGGRHIVDQPLWRFEQHHITANGHAWLSAHRLVAADGAETTLEPFTDTSGWSAALGATADGAGPSGAPAMRFTIGPQITSNRSTFINLPASRRFNRSVLPSEHPAVKFWWKVDVPATTGINPDDQILAYREDYNDGGAYVNGAIAWLQPFTPATTAARAESAAIPGGGTARYGTLSLDGYFTLATKLTRRMVQLDDGTLIVHDTLLPDKDAGGRNAGPVWQLEAGAPPVQVATGVYDATGFHNTRTLARGTDHLLVIMEHAPGRDFGSQRPSSPLWAGTNPYATYARSTLREGVPVSFVTILIPNDGTTPAAALASRVRIQRNTADNITIQIDSPAATPTAATTTQITLGPDDEWNVDNISTPQPATITLGGLIQPYDGTPRPVTATTNPAGLSVVITYGDTRNPDAPAEIGAYPIVAQINSPGYHGETTATLTINPPLPFYVAQPLPRVAVIGSTVTFAPIVSGAEPMTLQWQKSTDNITFADIPGATGATLTINNVQATDAGWYQLVATNTLGTLPSATVELALVPTAFPAPAPDGFAQAATGGGTAPDILVTTEAGLREYAALDAPAVLTLRGNITLAPGAPLILASDKTLQGIDSAATLAGSLQIGPGSQNIIVRGLNLSNPADAPALAITAATDIFVSHITLFATGSSDGPLATIDSTSDNITLAWSELTFTTPDGARSALHAGEGRARSPGAPLPAITLHHNHWQNAAQDQPLATNARVHLYNNHFTATGNHTTTIVVGDDAQTLVESNAFDGVTAGLTLPGTNALAKTDCNAWHNGAPPVQSHDHVFAPDYPYLMTSATGVRTLVPAHAGNTAGAATTAPKPAITLAISGTEGAVPNSVAITFTSTLSPGAQTASWQWRHDNFRLTEGDAYEGLDTPTLTILPDIPARKARSGAYTLQATLENGDIIVSNPKHIAIGDPVPPIITKHPFVTDAPDGQTSWPVPIRTPVSISADAEGDPMLKYQWQKRKNATYNNLAGATLPTLNLGAVTVDDGGVYRVQVFNNSGTATSADLTLIVTNVSDAYQVGNTRADESGGSGGGAFSPWCMAALTAFAATRLLRKNS